MRFKPFLSPLLGVFLVCGAVPAFSQVAPEATRGGLPLVVGGGFSDYDIDFDGVTRMQGLSVWAQYYFEGYRFVPRGLALDVEGHDIAFGVPKSFTTIPGYKHMREAVAEGGPLYSWQHYRNFHPYAKFLIGHGGIDFPPIGNYDHDTRTVYSPGGGIEYRAYKNIWVRGDYEYEFWPKLFGPRYLTPSGFTVGASYDFGHRSEY